MTDIKLSSGEHEITVEVFDKSNAKATASVNVKVNKKADTDDDGNGGILGDLSTFDMFLIILVLVVIILAVLAFIMLRRKKPEDEVVIHSAEPELLERVSDERIMEPELEPLEDEEPFDTNADADSDTDSDIDADADAGVEPVTAAEAEVEAEAEAVLELELEDDTKVPEGTVMDTAGPDEGSESEIQDKKTSGSEID